MAPLAQRPIRGQQLQMGGRRVPLQRAGPGQVWKRHALQFPEEERAGTGKECPTRRPSTAEEQPASRAGTGEEQPAGRAGTGEQQPAGRIASREEPACGHSSGGHC